MWYVAQVISGQKYSAEWYLHRAGFPSFSPRVITPTGGNREMFPGYLMVMLPTLGLVNRVCRTQGVLGMLPVGAEEPAPLQEGFVEELIERGPLELTEAQQVIRRWSRGEAVQVTGGAWTGLAGDVVGYRGGRVEVMIQGLFRAGVKAFVPEGMLRASGVANEAEVM